jgi:chaperonin GroES
MKFRPLHDRVAVEPMEQEEKSAGGVIIPDTAKEKPMQGKVVAVGDGAKGDDGKKVPLDVKEGDTVLYGKWAGTEISIEGQTILVMRESDVMGVVA